MISSFKNILIALDFKAEEEKAKIDHAIAMVQTDNGMQVTLLTVIPEVVFDREKDIVPAEKQQELLLNKANQQLQSIAENFPDADKITCLTEVGAPPVEIVKQVLRGQHDLLLTSTRKQKTVKEHILGSTMVELMRQCPCPVWAIKPEAIGESRIMVGIHFDEKVADHNDTLNHRLIEIALSLSEDTNKEVHLVNVVTKSQESVVEERLMQLKKLSGDFPEIKARAIPVVLEGDIVTTIPEYTKEKPIDILVMGMLSRTGLKGFFIGNTAEKIMDDVDCSLLVVKPKEFVSQITV